MDFSPGQGEHINAWLARLVAGARHRIILCAMLFTSSRLLRALGEALDRGIALSGVYDKTQMDGVLNHWREDPALAWKVEVVSRVVRAGRLTGKASRPYRPDRPNNFMHNKTLVVDDKTVTGSYNFSHAAQDNAENILRIGSRRLADQVAAETERLAGQYARAG